MTRHHAMLDAVIDPPHRRDTLSAARTRARRCTPYDVIVVGGRCAGSASARLLARAGMRVLVIDRATFPSDTISGHLIKPAGVAYLALGTARPAGGDRVPADPAPSCAVR